VGWGKGREERGELFDGMTRPAAARGGFECRWKGVGVGVVNVRW
jgi:hypothetical protein